MRRPTQQAEVHPLPPFDFDLTCRAVAAYAGGIGLDAYRDGAYWRALERDGKPLLASARSVGTVEEPRLAVEVHGSGPTEADVAWAASRMAHILAADLDLGPFYALVGQDPVIGPLVGELHGFHPGRAGSVYEALVLAITGQQIANVVARLIRADLLQRLGTPVSNGEVTCHAFPSARAILGAGVDGLRALRLSTRKAEYILDICARVAGGDLNLEALSALPRLEVMDRLCNLRGVGRWTAEWVMARALGRGDAFPSGDLALRRVLANLYNGGRPLTVQEADALGERWGDYRGIAVAYLFAGLRLGLREVG